LYDEAALDDPVEPEDPVELDAAEVVETVLPSAYVTVVVVVPSGLEVVALDAPSMDCDSADAIPPPPWPPAPCA